MNKSLILKFNPNEVNIVTDLLDSIYIVKQFELNIYDHALDFIFKNDDVKNIAISGAYSAGKSSVLETYKKKHSRSKNKQCPKSQYSSSV